MASMRPKLSSSNTSRRRTQQNTMRASGLSVIPSAVEFTTPNVILTFATPMVIRGIPQYETDTEKLPVSASISADHMTVTLVYDTPGSVTEITVPTIDPSLSTYTGGRVSAGTFPAS